MFFKKLWNKNIKQNMESTISIINFNTFDENNSEIKDTSSSQLSLAFIESETKEFNLFSKNKLLSSHKQKLFLGINFCEGTNYYGVRIFWNLGKALKSKCNKIMWIS